MNKIVSTTIGTSENKAMFLYFTDTDEFGKISMLNTFPCNLKLRLPCQN